MNDTLKQQIIQLETELLQSEVRNSPEKLSELLAEDFLEIGHTGKLWTRSDVLASLPLPSSETFTPTRWQVTQLSSDTFLITYLLQRENRDKPSTWRSSIWQSRNESWKLLFHQGTVCVEL